MLNKRPSVLAKLPVGEVPVEEGAEDVFDEVLDVLEVVVRVALPDVINLNLEVYSVYGCKETTDDVLDFEVVVVGFTDELLELVFETVVVVFTEDKVVAVAEAVPGTHCA